MYIPNEAMQLFNEGYGTNEVVRRKILNAEGRPASKRTARRWRNYWKSLSTKVNLTVLDEITNDEVKELKTLMQNVGYAQVGQYVYSDEIEEEPDLQETSIALAKDSPQERIRKYREAAERITELMNEADPIFTHQTKIFDTNKPIAIMFSSCMHLGGRYTNHAFIEHTLQEFSEFGYIFLIGDEIEGFTPSWFHSGSIVEQALQVPLQIQMFDAYMDDLKHCIIGGMWSQHGSMWFEKNQGYTPLKRRYLERGIPFFDGKANLTYQVGNQVYYIVASHEFSGVSQWNKNHPHIKALRFDYPSADVIVAGDKHTYAVQELQVYTEEYEAGRRKSPFVWLVQSGTAKTGPDKYTIKRWSKGESEWPIVVLYPDQHLIKVTRHIGDARQWISEY